MGQRLKFSTHPPVDCCRERNCIWPRRQRRVCKRCTLNRHVDGPGSDSGDQRRQLAVGVPVQVFLRQGAAVGALDEHEGAVGHCWWVGAKLVPALRAACLITVRRALVGWKEGKGCTVCLFFAITYKSAGLKHPKTLAWV